MTEKSTKAGCRHTAKPVAASLLVMLFLSASAHAGAWVQKRGAKQLITTASIYQASHYFDVSGKRQPQATYLKQEIAAYGEYGLTKDWTLGGQLRVVQAAQDGFSAKNIGDSEIFARRRLWQDDLNVLSLQPGIVIPSPDGKRIAPKIGADHMAYGLRASYGRNFKLRGRWHYADLGMGYLHRAGKPGDQYALDATAGFKLNKRWQVVPQFFVTKSRQGIKPTRFTESSANDYDLMKAQLSLQYSWRKRRTVSVGVFENLRGRNTGQGGGVLVSYGMQFP